MPALQLELTRTPKMRNQTCAAIKTLAHLADLGYDFKQVNNRIVDKEAPPVGSWVEDHGPWAWLPSFPSMRTTKSSERMHTLGVSGGQLAYPGVSVRNAAMRAAYGKDFASFSTNLIAMHRAEGSCGKDYPGKRQCPKWPSLVC